MEQVEVNASQPIVPFRETIAQPAEGAAADAEWDDAEASVSAQTADRRCALRLRALPLPPAVTDLLERHADLLRRLTDRQRGQPPSSSSSAAAGGSAEGPTGRTVFLLLFFLFQMGPTLLLFSFRSSEDSRRDVSSGRRRGVGGRTRRRRTAQSPDQGQVPPRSSFVFLSPRSTIAVDVADGDGQRKRSLVRPTIGTKRNPRRADE